MAARTHEDRQAWTDDEVALVASSPAVVRGADERRFVRRQCLDSAVRQSAAVGLLVLPMIAVVALAFASADGGRFLIAWIIGASIAEGLVVAAVIRYRASLHEERPEDAVVLLHVAFGAVGAVWGATTFVIDWSQSTHVSAFVMFPFTIAVLTMVQTAPVSSLFRASQVSLIGVALLGLVSTHTPTTLVIAASAVAWFLTAEILHRSMNATVIQGVQLRWRADELVSHLRAERVRLAEANLQLAVQAVHDPLTGLLNRRGAMEVLEGALAESAAAGTNVGVLYLDLDMFKSVNDSMGHRAGDQLLEIMAERIRSSLRSTATAGRLGGDELVAVVPDCSDLDTLTRIAGRLRAVMAEPVEIEGKVVVVSASIGVSMAPEHGSTATDLLRTANEGLHRAKARGRNRVVTFDESLRVEIAEKAELEEAVRSAIRDHRIIPLFLPEVDALTGRLIGAEIVPRCLAPEGTHGPDIDLTSPSLDPSTVEHLTHVVVDEARPAIRQLVANGLPAGFRFRINISARASARTWSSANLRALTDGIDPSLWTVSVTEQAIRHDLTLAAAALGAFRALGIRVALDDVSAGSTSLSVLRTVPLDEIRIDRASLDSVDTRAPDRAIVRALVGLARDLGLRISAAGVDSGAQADALMVLGCTRQQGAHFASAMTARELADLVADGAQIGSVPR